MGGLYAGIMGNVTIKETGGTSIKGKYYCGLSARKCRHDRLFQEDLRFRFLAI